MKSYQLHTFGCKVNVYDSGLIQKNLKQNGFNLQKDSGQVHILNTCAVTQEATKEAIRIIRKIKSKDPFATIVVTGCAAQVDTSAFLDMSSVDLVVANSHKGYLPFILDQHFKGVQKEKVFKSNIFKKLDLEAEGGIEDKHTRAFLKIQDGCNSFCSYCVIPYARGLSRSLSIKDLVRRVNELYENGFGEVVLTGVHIGDYNDEIKSDRNRLENLIEELLLKTKMQRLRLTSLEPVELSDHLMELYQDSRLCPHFHMSIQSANTEILKLMKRNYTQKEVVHSLNVIHCKIPRAFIGMDVITGFTGETEEYFEDTYKTLSELPWTKMHVFPYSERQGTKAMTMENKVELSTRKSRASKLRDLSQHRYQSEMIKQKNDIKQVLVLNEKIHNDTSLVHGLSRDYWPVNFKSAHDNIKPGDEVNVKIDKITLTQFSQSDGTLEGILC